MKKAPGIEEMNSPSIAVITDNLAGALRMTHSKFG